jgi:hypothetical protein
LAKAVIPRAEGGRVTAILDPRTADKLAKLCGMFGSDHLGERAAAAQMAHRLVKESGLSWFDVIRPSAPTASIEDQIEFCLQHEELLNTWEWGFLNGVRGRQFLTEKQLAKLGNIVAKAKAFAEAA